MAEQAGKERLNNNEFRELIPHLPLADLLRIEYRKDKWYKLITVSDPVKKLYGCSLCSITNSNVKNLTAHMEGKKHKVNINDVKQLFHPEYTYMKQDWKLAVGAVKPPVGSKTSVQKVKNNDGASTPKPENTTNQSAAKTNKNEAAITLKPENISQNVVTTNKNEQASSSSALKNKAIIAKTITATKPASKPITALLNTNSTKPVTTNSTPAAKASINTTKVGVKAGVPKIPAATAAKKASITPSKPLIKPQVGTQSINAAKPTISNNTQSTIESNTKQAPDNTIVKNPAKANTLTVAKPNQLNQHTQVATKQISKANNESASAKNSNISATEKHDTAIQSASSMKSSVSESSIDINVQKETSHDISVKKEADLVLPRKIGPNANDPSWNPKVSVKNLNVAKIAKTTEANTSQRDPKDQSPTSKSKFSGIKVSLKKVRTTEKSEPQHLKEIVNKETSSVNTPDTDNTTQSSGSKPEGTGLEDSYVIIDLVEQENSATKVNPDPNLVSSADNEVTRKSEATKLQSRNIHSIESKECELNERLNAESIKAKFHQSEFSNDVQFDEMLVKFDDKLNVPQTNLVKNPFALKHDGSKSRVVKISCVSTDKLKKPVTEKLSTGDMQISQEVIVIDDDSPLTEQHTEQNLLQKSSVIGSHLPKPQRDKVRRTEQQKNSEKSVDIQENTTKRNSESGEAPDNGENLPKKQKVVLNPAAAFLVEATSEKNEKAVEESVRSDKPKYQTDRIIIPTVHKPKHDEPSLKNIKLNFSTKTFSSKPKDDDIHGLLGVEYVVKIMKSREDISPRYECSLCELILDGPSMQNHLVAYNHRLKFCEKHFPTALRQYRQYLSKVPSYETYKVLTPILAKLAVAIEQHHGRDLPYEVLEHDYNANRHEILSKVFSCRHASEQYGPAFTHVLDAKEIDVIIAQKDNFKPQVGPPVQIFNLRPGGIILPRRERKRQRSDANEKQGSMTVRPHPYLGSSQYRQSATSNYSPGYVPPVDDETHKKMVADFLRGTHQSGSPGGRHHDNRDRERRSRRSRSRERPRRRSRSRSNQRQQRNLRKSISPLREGDIWQAYRHLVDQKVYDLNEVFKLYRSDPETHPMYNDEWQKFWKRRKDELIAAGLDHRSYNYQPEWVRFFKVRIEELYSQALENIKIQSRERLCLPMSNNSLTDSKYHVQARNVYPGTPATDADNEDCLSAEMMYRQKSGNPNVIAVLRLLTALEEHLGSLGPKIIDLMSKSLLIEKSHPDQINDIILTMDNCTLLQTAMEKLKGLLFAGLLEGTKERAFKKVIADTESLLSFAEEERKKKPLEAMPQTFSMPNKPIYRSMAPAPVPAPAVSNSTMQLSSGHSTTHTQQPTAKGSSQVDKKELAAKLAATLTAQGKTDFNPDQLEQLIAVYTLIEKKKREAAAATMSTSSSEAASFQPTSMSNRKTLSDTLVDFMNPSNPNSSNTVTTPNAPENSIAKQSYTTATINRYLEVMRRMGGNFPNSGVGSNANEIWHNLQNIQRGMGANTNVNQSREGHSGNNTFDYVGPSSFNTSNQFGINSIASKEIARKDSLSMGSNANSSFRPNSARGNLNTFVSGMGGNQPQPLLSYQQQNSYLANTISQNLSSEYNAGGSTFGNTNNNSRVNPNNIGINPKQPNQQNRPTQSFQGKNPNQNWVTKAPGNIGINKRRNNQPRGGGSEGGGPRNTSGIGKNQIWRNN